MTTWLDLQNAYGTEPHNLIQFALEWYHIPEHIRNIVFNYYNQLFICVKTKEWTTDWIQCCIGVFQGCPLSCILFLAIFNLCLDLLDQSSHLGYCMSKSDITSSAKAYADDLTLIAKNPEGYQQLISVVDDFLKWTRTMKAKPVKCKSHAMKKFVPSKQQKQDGHMTLYVAYDPQLEIDGKQITYIHSQPIRFLGKRIYKDLKDGDIRQMVNQKLLSMLNTTEKSQLSGIMKLWVYNNDMTWEFTIYNFQKHTSKTWRLPVPNT